MGCILTQASIKLALFGIESVIMKSFWMYNYALLHNFVNLIDLCVT